MSESDSHIEPELEGEDEDFESEIEYESSWASESSRGNVDSDNDEDYIDILDPNGPDEEQLEVDAAADRWLARFPGGTSALYPHLFVVKPKSGELRVSTPPRIPTDSRLHLLGLPSEIRNRIYEFCFEGYDDEYMNPKENYAPFRNREGKTMPRICLGSENVELKFLLSTAIIQTSRQLRFEATAILFNTHVVTVEWLPALPRFINFLEQGCAMVSYLDIWDTLDTKGGNWFMFRDTIASIGHFPALQHLRLVLNPGIGMASRNRCEAWFDRNAWTQDEQLKKESVAKMRVEHIEDYWPEYETLKGLKAQKFTLALDTSTSFAQADYYEFDRNGGPYGELCKAMKINAANSHAMSATENHPPSRIIHLTDSDEVPDSHTWQETHPLGRIIPLYNFFRSFFHDNRLDLLVEDGKVHDFVTFPTARASTGAIIQDCGICYILEKHCGYHSFPNQPPFRLKNSGDVVETLKARYDALSYVEMRDVCQEMLQWPEEADGSFPMTRGDYFGAFVAVAAHLGGWPEPPNAERLSMLDATAAMGGVVEVDKNQVTPWDLLYREIHKELRLGDYGPPR